MTNLSYARKRRQLKSLGRQLQHLLKEEGRTSARVQLLITKIKQLVDQLKHVVSRVELRRALGAVALLFGLSASADLKAQSFGPAQNNPFGLTATNDLALPAFGDLDNDGDYDLMVGEYYGGLQYFENTGTAASPQFAAPQSAPFGLNTSSFPYIAVPSFVDLDNDGDMDLMVGNGDYYGGQTLIYFENTGTAASPQFGTPQPLPFGLAASPPQVFAMPTFADLDNDGDMDMLVGEYYGNLKFYENTGSAASPQFGTPQNGAFGIDTTGLGYLAIPAFGDLDEDGDLDLLVGEYNGSTYFYENTGSASNPQFASPQQNAFGLTSVYYYAAPALADLDGDADLDLLLGEAYGNMVYFENTSSFSIDEQKSDFAMEVFPNPATNYLRFEGDIPISSVEVLSLTGERLVMDDKPSGELVVSDLASGIYLLKATDADGGTAYRKFHVK